MTEVERSRFFIRYEGGGADTHAMSARDLASSIDGIDKIVSAYIAALQSNGINQRRLKEPAFQLTVVAGREGSFDLVLAVQHLAAVALPFYPYLQEWAISQVSEHLLNSVLLFFARKRPEADRHLDKALDIIAEMAAAAVKDRQDERAAMAADRKDEREFLKALFEQQREVLEPAARKAVAPVGRSCHTMSLPSPGGSNVVIDGAAAAAIRGESASIGPRMDEEVSSIAVRFDLLKISTLQFSAYLESDPGRQFPVSVLDPALEAEGSASVYEQAFSGRRTIVLTGVAQRNLEGDVTKFFATGGKLQD